MATLFVPATTDFRGGAAETNIDQIQFTSASAAVATFGSNQFGPGLIENDVTITGNNQINHVQVVLSATGISPPPTGSSATGIHRAMISSF